MSVRDLSPAVFRGEVNGTLRERGGWLRPYFFAEQASLATSYARGTQPLCCVLQGQSMLDLTEPNPMNPVHRDVVQRLEARFDHYARQTPSFRAGKDSAGRLLPAVEPVPVCVFRVAPVGCTHVALFALCIDLA